MKSIGVVYTTVSNQAQADSRAGKAIEEKLAACINMFPNTVSMYVWNEKVERSGEIVMIFKTTLDKIELLQRCLEEHPYEIPMILKGAGEANTLFVDYVRTLDFRGVYYRAPSHSA